MALSRTRTRRKLRRGASPGVRRTATGGSTAKRSEAKALMGPADAPVLIGGAKDPAETTADRSTARVLAGPLPAQPPAAASSAAQLQPKSADRGGEAEQAAKPSGRAVERASD